jgi:hypothetical protein
MEGGHRLLPPIMSKNQLIEVDLELSAANAVIGTDQPLLEVADRAVGQRHRRLGTLAQIDSQRLRAQGCACKAAKLGGFSFTICEGQP